MGNVPAGKINWTCKLLAPGLLQVRFPLWKGRPRFLMTADQHFDSKLCDVSMLHRHYHQARREGAGIIQVGDWFDAMQSADDPRRTKMALKDEHTRTPYLNELIQSTLKFCQPFKDNLLMWGYGNHETALCKKMDIDLIMETVERLREKGSPVERMGLRGFIIFRGEKKNGRLVKQWVMAFSHGAGGGGEVTKGTIRSARRAAYYPDADVVVAGHIHEAWTLEIPRVRVQTGGHHRHIYQDTQYHVQLPTYKQEYNPSGLGFHHDKERPPKPLGGYWIEFGLIDHSFKTSLEKGNEPTYEPFVKIERAV